LIDTDMQYQCDEAGRRWAYLMMEARRDDPPRSWYVTDEQAAERVRHAVRVDGIVPDVEADGTITLITLRWNGKPKVTVTLKPTIKTPLITTSMAEDLEALLEHGGAVYGAGHIYAGRRTIRPAETARLYARGLVEFVDEDDAPVTVALAGCVGLTLRTHHTSTTEPMPAAKALCSCGWARLEDRRENAQWAAKQHREKELRAALIRFAKS
jgi:hypothetical protein